MTRLTLIALVTFLATGSAMAREAEPLHALAEMPIKEITVFKDGHAFVLHSGKMPVNAADKVVMDYLPAPVLGTYWPYSADPNAQLLSVTAGQRKVLVEKTAITIREMIEANIGAGVFITERPAAPNSRENLTSYEATIVEIPARSGEELEALTPSSSDERIPQKGKFVMLKTDKGVKALEFARILDVTFAADRKRKVSTEEFRNLLTLDLKWQGKPRREAEMGMIYLQKGIRWILSYSIDIDGNGKAVLKLQATLINELADINDVTAHLVIGVPSFAFKDSVDPISLRQDVAQLSSSFRPNSQTAYGFSNAIMTQSMRPSAYRPVQTPQPANTMALGPKIGGARKSEDLYMFTIKHVSLRKGERMDMPIAQYELSYEDVYALDIPYILFTPTSEALRNLHHQQRMDPGPKVKHKIRIANKSEHPFTTAPATILKDGRIVAQGIMPYTPVGGDVDIELTTVFDIRVKKVDHETKRTPNAIRWHNRHYGRIDLEGKITLTNYTKKPITIEITRYVLGNIDAVGQDGKKEMVYPFEDQSFQPNTRTAQWWYGYSWPWWWHHFNGVGKIKWTTTLEPHQSAKHTYKWHYCWLL